MKPPWAFIRSKLVRIQPSDAIIHKAFDTPQSGLVDVVILKCLVGICNAIFRVTFAIAVPFLATLVTTSFNVRTSLLKKSIKAVTAHFTSSWFHCYYTIKELLNDKKS